MEVEADDLSGNVGGGDGGEARRVPAAATADDGEEEDKDSEENQSMPGPLENGEYAGEDIISQRKNLETNIIEFKVKWVGHQKTTFEPMINLYNSKQLVKKFKKNQKRLAAKRRKEERLLLFQQAAAPPHHPVSASNSAASSSQKEAAEEDEAEGGDARPALDAREAVGVDEDMEVAAEDDQAEGGDARPALDAREAVGVDEDMEVAAEDDQAEGGEAAPRAQKSNKIEGDRALRSTMVLVNAQDELDKLYNTPCASYPSFKCRSKKRKTVFFEFYQDPFVP